MIPGAKVFRTLPQSCEVRNYNVVAELNLDPGAATATLDIQVDPGRTLVVNPVRPRRPARRRDDGGGGQRPVPLDRTQHHRPGSRSMGSTRGSPGA